MNIGDWVVLPLRTKLAIAVGEIKSAFTYDVKADIPYRSYRDVKWLARDLLRSAFDQVLLYSFGAFLTFCLIKRNDVERRVRQRAQNNWQSTVQAFIGKDVMSNTDTPEEIVDLECLARDHIARLISGKFKGLGMERVVEAIPKRKAIPPTAVPKVPTRALTFSPRPTHSGSVVRASVYR